MLTLEEQLIFIKERKNDYIKIVEFRNKNLDTNLPIPQKIINQTIFCYDSIIQSINELQALKTKSYGK